MATEINTTGRQALKAALQKFAADDEVWRDGQGTYFVGNDVENNSNYDGCVFQGTVATVIDELSD